MKDTLTHLIAIVNQNQDLSEMSTLQIFDNVVSLTKARMDTKKYSDFFIWLYDEDNLETILITIKGSENAKTMLDKLKSLNLALKDETFSEEFNAKYEKFKEDYNKKWGAEQL